jgi:DNA topoisomerase-1
MLGVSFKSKETISKSLDRAMDKSNPAGEVSQAGISIRNGPVDEMDIDGPATDTHLVNGAKGKRKSRASLGNTKTYKEASSDPDVDDAPLVWFQARRKHHTANRP